MQTGQVTTVTGGPGSAARPQISGDGKKIAFVSERGEFLNDAPQKFDMFKHDYENTDIYIVDIETHITQ